MTSFSLLVLPLLTSIMLVFSAAAAQCSLLSCCPSGPPGPFPGAAPRPVDPSLCCTPGLFFPRTLRLPLLNFTRFLSAHSSSLSRSFCRVVLSYKACTSPLSFIPSSRSLTKTFKCTGPNIEPLGTQFGNRLPV